MKIIRYFKTNLFTLAICTFLLDNSLVFGQKTNISKPFILNSKNLLEEAKKKSPTLENIKSNFYNKKLDKNKYLEGFQLNLVGDINYKKTNKDALFEFQPIISPLTNFSLGLDKKFKTGMSVGLKNTVDNRKYGSLGVISNNMVTLEFTMDLYQDFFGKDSKTRIDYLDYEVQVAKIQKDIDEEIFLINLNRIYLNIIYTQEAINISRDILGVYKKQEDDVKKRYKDGIADLSEVKRRYSQVSSKRVDILNLVNRQENIILDLKKLLPSIASKTVLLDKYNIKKQENNLSLIFSDIRSKKLVPMDYTYYDELVNLIEKSYKKQTKFTKNYSDIDVEFYSSYTHQGTSNESVKDATARFYNSSQEGYNIGLRLKAPIGKAKIDSEKIQLSIQNSNFLAKKKENLAKIEAYHSQIIKNLDLLNRANKYQKENSLSLKKIMLLSKKKYKQARMPIRDLIEDQDLYLRSLLSEVEIRITIVDQLFNYMSVFTKTPYCFFKCIK